jgi:hypothetical protein
MFEKNGDNATKNQNDKDIFENKAKKSGKKQNKYCISTFTEIVPTRTPDHSRKLE